MILLSSMKFQLGQLVITPAALEAIPTEHICQCINRHVCGDWGDLEGDDRRENELALRIGSRLLSVYHTETDRKFYIITEADRTATTVLLPEDY
jgi:hypothetical protein